MFNRRFFVTCLKIVTCPVEAFYFEKPSGGFCLLCCSRCIIERHICSAIIGLGILKEMEMF